MTPHAFVQGIQKTKNVYAFAYLSRNGVKLSKLYNDVYKGRALERKGGYLTEWGFAPRSRKIVEFLKPRGSAGEAALVHCRAGMLPAAEKEGETEIVAEL